MNGDLRIPYEEDLNVVQTNIKLKNRIADSLFEGDTKIKFNKNILLSQIKKQIDKKEQKLSSLKTPSSRNDVEALKNWMDKQLVQIYKDDSLNIRQIFEKSQMIYIASFKELCRQVSIECTQRGQLLDVIWENYMELLEKSILEVYRQKAQEENDHVEEVSRIHKLYGEVRKNFKAAALADAFTSSAVFFDKCQGTSLCSRAPASWGPAKATRTSQLAAAAAPLSAGAISLNS